MLKEFFVLIFIVCTYYFVHFDTYRKSKCMFGIAFFNVYSSRSVEHYFFLHAYIQCRHVIAKTFEQMKYFVQIFIFFLQEYWYTTVKGDQTL